MANCSRVYDFFRIPQTTGSFQSWNDAFQFLGEKARQQRFVLVFDEFPYAAYENRALRSILQNTIDHQLKDSGLFLILCGSQVCFMENEVLGYKSPLFGRRTAQIKLEALDYYDSAKMYNSIVSAIAAGASRINDMANRIGEESSKVGKYLRTLTDLNIVKKEYPFGDDPATSRKAIYKLADNCYLFWYRFVFPAKPEIESGSGQIIAQRLLSSEQLAAFLGKPAFEDI